MFDQMQRHAEQPVQPQESQKEGKQKKSEETEQEAIILGDGESSAK